MPRVLNSDGNSNGSCSNKMLNPNKPRIVHFCTATDEDGVLAKLATDKHCCKCMKVHMGQMVASNPCFHNMQ